MPSGDHENCCTLSFFRAKVTQTSVNVHLNGAHAPPTLAHSPLLPIMPSVSALVMAPTQPHGPQGQ